jgi:hypothetical protein
MMTDPITPPPELVHQWADMLASRSDQAVFTMAAQWGADQELEACCEWTAIVGGADALRAARRPKPPSLKEQALALVEQHEEGWRPSPKDWDTIRRALEALDD